MGLGTEGRVRGSENGRIENEGEGACMGAWHEKGADLSRGAEQRGATEYECYVLTQWPRSTDINQAWEVGC